MKTDFWIGCRGIVVTRAQPITVMQRSETNLEGRVM